MYKVYSYLTGKAELGIDRPQCGVRCQPSHDLYSGTLHQTRLDLTLRKSLLEMV